MGALLGLTESPLRDLSRYLTDVNDNLCDYLRGGEGTISDSEMRCYVCV